MPISFKHDSSTIYELTRKQVKTQYRDSSLGFIWTVLNPLLTMLVMWFVFDKIFGGDDPYYPIYLLTGNILFTAIRNSSVQCLESLVIHRDLLLRTKVELYVFPFSNCVSTLVNFAFSLIALIPFLIVKSITIGAMPPEPALSMKVLFETVPVLFSYQLPFLLLMLPAFFLFELGVGFFLSIIYVFFRDIKHIYSIFLVLWMYMTPIFYKVDLIAEKSPAAFKILKLNPMYHFTKYFRECIYGGATGFDFEIGKFTIKEAAEGGAHVINTYLPTFGTLGWCYVCGVAAFIIGFTTFQIFKRKAIMRI